MSSCIARNAAQRRYNRDVLWLSAAYALLLLAVTYLFRHAAITGVPAVMLAVLPALPIIGVFAAIARYLFEERDEYLRVLTVRQTLVASGFALSIATVWGFLESFGVAGHIDAYFVAVLWFAGLGLGSCVNRLIEARA